MDINIISVIITVISILFGIFSLFKDTIINIFNKFRYKGAKIDGKYTCSYKNNEDINYKITLKQIGKKIKGVMEYIKDSEGNYQSEIRIAKGEIRGVNLLLFFEDIENKDLSFGYFIFRINLTLKRLEGIAIGYYSKKNSYYKEERNWNKVN